MFNLERSSQRLMQTDAHKGIYLKIVYNMVRKLVFPNSVPGVSVSYAILVHNLEVCK